MLTLFTLSQMSMRALRLYIIYILHCVIEPKIKSQLLFLLFQHNLVRFEKNYNPYFFLKFLAANSWIAWGSVATYFVLIFAGQEYFKTRPAWDWRNMMASWNLGLSVFSWYLALKVVPHLIHNLTTMSFRDNMCTSPLTTYGQGTTGLWCLLFVFSKFPELFDTFFIVIHKKPLIFLHWYHHITVLLYCWFSFTQKSPPSIFFVAMNACVHGVMYGYYYLAAKKMRPKWMNPMFITSMQISQMWLGVFITLSGLYYYKADPTCEISKENMTAAFLMYGSYLFLFCNFFIGRYIQPKFEILSKKNKSS